MHFILIQSKICHHLEAYINRLEQLTKSSFNPIQFIKKISHIFFFSSEYSPNKMVAFRSFKKKCLPNVVRITFGDHFFGSTSCCVGGRSTTMLQFYWYVKKWLTNNYFLFILFLSECPKYHACYYGYCSPRQPCSDPNSPLGMLSKCLIKKIIFIYIMSLKKFRMSQISLLRCD